MAKARFVRKFFFLKEIGEVCTPTAHLLSQVRNYKVQNYMEEEEVRENSGDKEGEKENKV